MFFSKRPVGDNHGMGLLSDKRVQELAGRLEPGGMDRPHNISVLSELSLPEREEFARKAKKMVLYYGEEVAAVQKAEEDGAMSAMPPGYSADKLNGLNIGCGNRLISPYLTPVDIMRVQPETHLAGVHHALTPGAMLALPDSLPFKEGSIDYIVALHMLEHVENPIRVIHHWLDVLKPGGGIGIVVPDWRYTWDSRKDSGIFSHKWNPTPSLIEKIYREHWDDRADLESLATYPYKLSFDFVLRKRGVFVPFSPPSETEIRTGERRHQDGIFLHGE